MDRELEQLLKDVMFELKDMTRVLRGTNKKLIEDAKTKDQERKAKKLLIKTMGDYMDSKDKLKDMTEDLKTEFKDMIPTIKSTKAKFMALPGPTQMVGGAFTFVKDVAFGLGKALAKTALALSDTTKTFNGVEDVIEAGFGEIPKIGPVMRGFGKEIDSNVETFKQLAKSGASFGSSIVMLRELQNRSGMPLEKFKNLIGDNSQMLAKLFGTVDQGVPQIAGLTRSLRTITERDFAKFGLTLDDTAGYMTTYLELERARGNTARIGQRELLDGTAKYTKNLVTLSKLTGESVDTLNEQNMAMAADGILQSQLAGMDKDRAKTLSLGFSELNPALRKLGTEFLALGAPISETSRDLEILSDGKYGQAFRKFNSDGDLVAFQNSIKTIGATVIQNSKAFGQAGLVTGRFVDALNTSAEASGLAVDPDVVKTQTQATGDNIKNLVNLNSQVDLVKTGLEDLRFKALTPLIYSGGKAAEATEALNRSIRKFATEGMSGIKKIVGTVSNTLTGGSAQRTDNSERFKNLAKGLDVYGNPIPIDGKRNGTNGFEQFGSGTPVMLHGSEAVVPEKSSLGQMVKEMMAFGTPVTNKAKEQKITSTNNSTSINNNSVNNSTMDISQLVKTSQDNYELNKKMAQHLNTLVTIGAMTEKNTKSTNNSLANMGGSLV
jgi:hypothetical protein